MYFILHLSSSNARDVQEVLKRKGKKLLKILKESRMRLVRENRQIERCWAKICKRSKLRNPNSSICRHFLLHCPSLFRLFSHAKLTYNVRDRLLYPNIIYDKLILVEVDTFYTIYFPLLISTMISVKKNKWFKFNHLIRISLFSKH